MKHNRYKVFTRPIMFIEVALLLARGDCSPRCRYCVSQWLPMQGVSPLLKPTLLALVYLPVWRCLAVCSICTCCKAFSREITYEERPDEERTSRADSCMLRLIKLRKVSCAILYLVYQLVYISYIKRHHSRYIQTQKYNYFLTSPNNRQKL